MDSWRSGKLRKVAVAVTAIFVAAGAYAAGNNDTVHPAENDVDNIQSLQRGAANFINYCSGCHSAEYVRFNTLARDLEISEEQLINNLMFNAEKTFETIQASMRGRDSARWFGQQPPDLSLRARAKGTDYIYSLLKSFYLDPDSPTGVDNLVLAGTGMPHVLWKLQGYQRAIFVDEPVEGEEGVSRRVFQKFEFVSEGTMSEQEYDGFVRDTVNFLEYIAEPERSTRRKVGTWVIIYLLFFLIISVMLKKEIWKDVN
jgi:ubiquinol-cytochrome c reductase cytochrome c1 subunit